MRRINRLSVLFLLLCPLLGHAVPPEWMRTVAQQPARKYADDVNAVTLYQEQEYTVKESGEIVEHSRFVYRILRREGRNFAELGVPFTGDSRVNYMKAWSITPGGQEYETKDKDVMEAGASGYEVYSDLKFKFVKVPGADVGAVVGFEYERKERPYTFQLRWNFQRTHPVELARFVLRLPEHWEYRSAWVNHASMDPSREGGAYIWEVRDVNNIEHEDDMPNWLAVAGRMVVTLFSEKTKGRTYANWNDFGQWYSQLSAGVRDPSPALQLKVRELAPANLPLLDRIKAVAAFAQREIRYAAIEIGIGGYRPHSAGDVFANRYGDCKDKATLLSSMLNEFNVKSYYILVHTNRGIFTEQSPPDIGFNHAILAIQMPEASYSKPMPALYEHPTLGHLLIFDPTNDLVPFGEIPYYEQDNYGLLVTPDGGELIHLPLSRPELNRITRTAKLTLQPDGSVKGEVEEVRTGTEAYLGRRQYRDQTKADRKKMLESLLSRVIGNFQLDSVEAENLDNIEREFTVRYKFTAEHYAKNTGGLLLVRPRVLGEKALAFDTKKPRLYPFQFRVPTLQTDTFEFILPDGYKVDELPEPARANYPFGQYASKIENTGSLMRYSREYRIVATTVAPEQIGDLKKFFANINADERNMAVLKKAN